MLSSAKALHEVCMFSSATVCMKLTSNLSQVKSFSSLWQFSTHKSPQFSFSVYFINMSIIPGKRERGDQSKLSVALFSLLERYVKRLGTSNYLLIYRM